MVSPANKIEPDGKVRRKDALRAFAEGNHHKPKPFRKCHICGANVTYCNFNRHAKTKKHRDAEYANFEKFEMK